MQHESILPISSLHNISPQDDTSKFHRPSVSSGTDMDTLKSAGRAIIRSPITARQSWTAGRHRKLPENWTDTRETILEGVTFNLRHLGMTLVDEPKGEELSAAAVKRIVATAKASGKKPQKVALKVSPQGISLHDSLTNKVLENVPIYRISYCIVDKAHDKVFAYIAQNTLNGTLECRAYLCSKRKVAQAVALTVAQAFTLAFELLQAPREEKGKRAKSGSAGEASSSSHSERSNSLGSLKGTDVATDKLLDIEDSVKAVVERDWNFEDYQLDNRPSETNNNLSWEIEDGLDEAFSSCALDSYGSCPDVKADLKVQHVVGPTQLIIIIKNLAVSRTNSQVLDTGLTPQDWLTEPEWHRNIPSSLSPFGDDVFGC